MAKTTDLTQFEDAGSPEDLVILVDESVDPRVIAYHDPQSNASEQFRAFRTTLLASFKQNPGPKVLTVTSAREKEGKTLSTANIGITLADLANKKVCLVDADLRKPTLNRLFSIPLNPGLADCLTDGLDAGQAIHNVCLGTMDVIPAGSEPRRAIDLLGSDRFKEVLNQLRASHDFVLIDTPPTEPFSDSIVVGGATDGTLLITRLQFSPRATIQQTIDKIKQAGQKVIGAFLVGADT